MTRLPLLLSVALSSVLGSTACVTPIKRDLSDISPESSVRVWHSNSACCASPLIGTFVNYDVDSVRVRVRPQGEPIALSRASIERIENAHRVGRGGRGALLGLGLGATVGAIIGNSTACRSCDGDLRGIDSVIGAAAGAFYGTIAGFIVGLAIRREIWDTVSPQ